MREHLRLGRVAGVAVGVNWSVLVIFGLIVVGLAAGGFPTLYPGRAPLAYAVAGLVAGVIFFLSLLAHELGHAVVARRNGVEVEGITLWLFGGVARLAGEAPDAGAELRIAGVGPLVSVVLAVAFSAVAVVLSGLGATGLLLGVFAWLALINLVLAVFNLVPAAPLDGGRLLRAALWRWHGDRHRAAVTAANAGRAFGGLLIAAGLWMVLFLAALNGLWFMLIGWFVINAASAEAQHARLQTALGDVRVRDVMTPDPVTAPAEITVAELLDAYVFAHRFSSFPLVGVDGRLAGLVTLNRIKQVPAARRAQTTLQQVGCPAEEVAIAAPDEPLIELLPQLQRCPDGRAVVVDGERVVGIVSPSDISRQLALADLREDPAAQPF